jgi:hypothetical protein
MAENTKNENKSKYEYPYVSDYQSDWENHSGYITNFDPWEAMMLGQVYDSVTRSVDNSKITDSYAMTLAKERADRVMAKLPEGETESVGKADAGKAAFMDILRQKWIYPNANSQHPFPVKLNMWQLYSSVYGYMPMFYDWNVSSTGYAGPDCWLWNPRNLVPQMGRISIQDMEYVTALTWVSKKYLRDKAKADLGEDKIDEIEDDSKTLHQGEEDEEDNDGWNLDAVRELLVIVNTQAKNPDTQKDTYATRTRTPQDAKKGICLATRYESGDDGEWITFAPDHGYVEVRRIKNPHKNGRIPFVVKYSQPLFDSFYGLGDFQRAKPLQFARDGLTNFYFQGIKMNLIPPLVVGQGALKHTIDYRPGAVMMENTPNSIRRLETSTAGLSTYQGAQSNLTGSLLSLYGSQNASLPGSESLNPSQGKTPQAISLYGDKEATRDGAERRNLEVAIEQLTDGFFSMISAIGTEDIPVALFAKDVQAIVDSGLTDVKDLFKNLKPDQTGTAADLKIKPKEFKDVEMRFNITPDSTATVRKSQELDEWERLVNNIMKAQNIFKDDPRVDINWPKIMEVGSELTNIPGVRDFVTVNNGPTKEELESQQQLQQLQQQNQELSQALQTMQQQNQMQQQNNVSGQQFNDPMLAQAAQSIMQ